MRFQLSVPDLSCQHCVRTVEAALAALGVRSLGVDLGAKTVAFEGEAERLPAVLEALAEEGYPAREV